MFVFFHCLVSVLIHALPPILFFHFPCVYSKDVKPCTCRDGFTGKHCEYRSVAVPTCDLQCLNGGQCHSGLRNATNHELIAQGVTFDPNDQNRFQFCECKEGFSGPLCGIEHDPCADGNTCYHGSTCRSYKDPVEGEQQACDCSSANYDGSSYAGRSCEVKAKTYCLKGGGSDGYAFCTNGGTCVNHNGIWGCNCPTGFVGPKCEHQDGGGATPEEAGTATCKTKCKNGGECRHGFKNHGIMQKFKNLGHITKEKTSSAGLEHCVCPEGWGGLYCDIEADVCGQENTAVCLHGAKCREKLDGGFDCDICQAAAGKFCEHKATSSCEEGHFCTNQGSCNGDGTCSCPRGWIGE